jgi:hypothetical protein
MGDIHPIYFPRHGTPRNLHETQLDPTIDFVDPIMYVAGSAVINMFIKTGNLRMLRYCVKHGNFNIHTPGNEYSIRYATRVFLSKFTSKYRRFVMNEGRDDGQIVT